MSFRPCAFAISSSARVFAGDRLLPSIINRKLSSSSRRPKNKACQHLPPWPTLVSSPLSRGGVSQSIKVKAVVSEAEAVPNPDAQCAAPHGESASAPSASAPPPSAAGTPAPSAADSQSDANREQGRSANPETRIPNPVSSANPESPNPAQKPKRKYTM